MTYEDAKEMRLFLLNSHVIHHVQIETPYSDTEPYVLCVIFACKCNDGTIDLQTRIVTCESWDSMIALRKEVEGTING